MKALLVHPHGSNWMGGGKDISSIFNRMPPIGLLSIAAVLEQRGIAVSLLDCYGRPDLLDRHATAILAERPDVVGFSCTTSSFLEGYALAQRVKEVRPELPIVFGGAHACSVGPALLDDFPAIDYLVIGEGELTFAELLQSGFRHVERIPGVAVRQHGRGGLTAVRQVIPNLDDLPFPAWHRLPGFPRQYNLPLFSYPVSPNTSIISSRGCPYQCSYCDRSVFSRGFRFNSPEYIVEHLRYLHRDFGIRHVFFYDDLFTFDRSRVERFCQLMVSGKVPVTYNCIARLEHVDRNLVDLLKRSGCWQVNFGIESGDQEVLAKHRALYSLDQVVSKLQLVKDAGMRLKGLFMMGFPGETEQSIGRTIDLALALPLDEINVTKFTPFPGAPVFKTIGEHGTFTEDWPAMNCLNFVFVPHGLTRDRLDELYNQFISRFYRRSRIHWGYAKMLWKSPHSIGVFLRNLPEILRFEARQRW